MIRQLEEREKRALRRALGIKPMHHGAVVNHGEVLSKPKQREYHAPVKSSYRPPKLRGRSGTRLSQAVRDAMALRDKAREEFFAALKS